MFDTLKVYTPSNEQEKTDLKAMLDFIDHYDNVLLRDNLIAHFTASAIVLNQHMDHILFAYHKIYDSWGWVGGHNDGDPDFLKVAIKEAMEETGIKDVYPFSEDILGIDIIEVPNHIKRGKYVGDHLHLNLTYLLIADDTQEIMHKPDENLDVKWFNLKTYESFVSENRMKPVYSKLIQKALKLKEKAL
ncbi:MAG: NUDIX hydrolase [Acholeplasmataceae bacterium]